MSRTKSLMIHFIFSLLLSSVWANGELLSSIKNNYAAITYESYHDSLLGARKLQAAILKFTRAAQEGQSKVVLEKLFDQAKMIWTNEARLPYGQSEIFRFNNGPIDFEYINDGVSDYLETINFVSVEGLVNAWPLDEAFIDYVKGNTSSGIINDLSAEINQAQIELLNERDGEKNVSSGFHAIEFLLWGQDFNLGGPGARPVSDYTTAKNAKRRRLYLNILASNLVAHLYRVTNQWIPGMMNYRHYFYEKSSQEVLKIIFTSMISMAGDELKSERIENALLLEDQEEEQSCFSDTTINDIYTNYKGIKNLYYGVYSSFNSSKVKKGAGLRDFILSKNTNLNKKIEDAFLNIELALAPFYNVEAKDLLAVRARKINLAFDVAIISNQKMVQNIIDRLNELDLLLKQAAYEFGVFL